ncbi:Aldehyde dehydrogenase [Blyttiomyces sp. JEL0837]|nr:Aldehyde dehydrogenase [Blyttiomyces sp. JEL0837]
MFPSTAQNCTHYPRIINTSHFNRLEKILSRQQQQSHSEIVYGGHTDLDDLYIEPTVFKGVKETDPLMEEEIFGPLIGIVEVEGVDEAIRIINSKDHPLSMNIFANNDVATKIIEQTNSGAVLVNDFLMNMAIHTLPFGGVGASGMGACHGKDSFLAFTHRRSTMYRPKGLEFMNQVRYPPDCLKPEVRDILHKWVRVRPAPMWRKVLGRLVEKFGGYALVALVSVLVGIKLGRGL